MQRTRLLYRDLNRSVQMRNEEQLECDEERMETQSRLRKLRPDILPGLTLSQHESSSVQSSQEQRRVLPACTIKLQGSEASDWNR